MFQRGGKKRRKLKVDELFFLKKSVFTQIYDEYINICINSLLQMFFDPEHEWILFSNTHKINLCLSSETIKNAISNSAFIGTVYEHCIPYMNAACLNFIRNIKLLFLYSVYIYCWKFIKFIYEEHQITETLFKIHCTQNKFICNRALFGALKYY